MPAKRYELYYDLYSVVVHPYLPNNTGLEPIPISPILLKHYHHTLMILSPITAASPAFIEDKNCSGTVFSNPWSSIAVFPPLM
jgi:hypothetical protein